MNQRQENSFFLASNQSGLNANTSSSQGLTTPGFKLAARLKNEPFFRLKPIVLCSLISREEASQL